MFDFDSFETTIPKIKFHKTVQCASAVKKGARAFVTYGMYM